MHSIKRIMVGLDLSYMDKQLVEYTAFLCYYLKPEKVYFINVQEDLEAKDFLEDQFPEIKLPKDEQVEADMRALIEENFPDHADFNTSWELVEGSPKKEILRWTHIKDIDLLIVGRKKSYHGSGLVPQQLARKITCSILFVPEETDFGLKEILVPSDFSEYSKMAMDEALTLANVDEDMHILCQHIYSVPYGYYKTGKTEAEFAQIMKEYAAEKYQAYAKSMADKIQETNNTLEPVFSYEHKRQSPAFQIHALASERKVDMIIIGARGHNAATALFLGSVAEKLIKLVEDIPLWIVKRKEKSFSFFDLIDAI